MSDVLLLNISNRVATITLNRPEKMNAISDEMLDEWIDALEACRTNDEVYAIVITGTGKAFSSGGDRGKFDAKRTSSSAAMRQGIHDNIQRLPRKFGEIDKPVIAALNGLALGAGLDVALMCDIRFAAKSARFAEVYAHVGLVPGAGGAYFLPRTVGMAKALEMLWTCDQIDADEAMRIGLVSGVFPDDQLLERTREFAERIAAKAPLAIRAIKRLAYQGMRTDMLTALDMAATSMPIVRGSDDHREAIDAAKEKRPPVFKGS